jgi:hypothetical protein
LSEHSDDSIDGNSTILDDTEDGDSSEGTDATASARWEKIKNWLYNWRLNKMRERGERRNMRVRLEMRERRE